METLIPLGNKRGVCSELLDVVLDGFVEAGNQRGNQHDDADAQHHAKNGEPAAHLVGAQSVHCLLEIFAVCLRHFVSFENY